MMDAMETASERICAILDTLSEPDQIAVVTRLVTITALRAEDTEDYLWALTYTVTDDIKAHLSSKLARAG
jgi:hypothetical protein